MSLIENFPLNTDLCQFTEEIFPCPRKMVNQITKTIKIYHKSLHAHTSTKQIKQNISKTLQHCFCKSLG